MSLRVAIIGGGLGGLSAAVYLRAQGHHVSLFEKNPILGGKASRFESKGYSFDTGPSLLTMPQVLDELFAVGGGSREQDLPLTRLDVQCRYFFPDGKKLDLLDDRAETLKRLAEVEPDDAARFEQFLRTARTIYEVTGKPYLDRPYEGFMSFGSSLKGSSLSALKWGVLQGTLGDVARRNLKSDRLRWIVNRYATYAGGGPDRSPAAFAMILHLETADGAWYPQGGIYSIVRATERLAHGTGVELHLSSDVERVLVRDGRVTALRVNGQDERFDAVVSNADPIFVAEKLLDDAGQRRSGFRKHSEQELGTSGVVLMLGVKGRLDHLAHHNVIFPTHYPDEFRDLFEHERAPMDPTVYLCIPSRTETGRAPDGCESVFAMINAPATSGRTDWQSQRGELAQRIKSVLERTVSSDLSHRIEVEEFIGPDELRGRFNAPGGSIYGVSPHGRLSPFHRPLPRAEGITGLYFAGGGTHPGGGIPLVIRSGKFAADLVQADLARGKICRLSKRTTEARV